LTFAQLHYLAARFNIFSKQSYLKLSIDKVSPLKEQMHQNLHLAADMVKQKLGQILFLAKGIFLCSCVHSSTCDPKD